MINKDVTKHNFENFLKDVSIPMFQYSIFEHETLKTLDVSGYVSSQTKFSPTFLKDIKDLGIQYIAFKELNIDCYHIILKSFLKDKTPLDYE